MKLLHIYWSALVVSAAFSVMYWFAPWAYGTLDSDTQNVLSLGGTGSWVSFPEWWSWVHLTITLAGYLGMFLLRKLFRWWFLATFIIGIALSPANGVSVITGIEVFMIDVSTFLSGFVLALAFFSPLNEQFS
jgi:hypothetical protein